MSLRRNRLLALLGLLLALQASAALADPTHGFRGRRVTGGMHGPCNSRLLLHLVPPDSMAATDASGLVGLLMGASQHPVPVAIQFRDGQRNSIGPARVLPADPEATITLLHAPAPERPLQWSSGFRCQDDTSRDPLAGELFMPAETLLTATARPQELRFINNLEHLQRHCGTRVQRGWLIVGFDLDPGLLDSLPRTIPVHCP
ncbi:MAG: hypothetical protein ACKO0M_09360 [Cyanobium sp.]